MVEKRTARGDVDRLITWYEKNKPEAGKRIEVKLNPKQLAKEFETMPPEKLRGIDPATLPKEHFYRGRTLVAVG